jgi:hypothetical protein
MWAREIIKDGEEPAKDAGETVGKTTGSTDGRSGTAAGDVGVEDRTTIEAGRAAGRAEMSPATSSTGRADPEVVSTVASPVFRVDSIYLMSSADAACRLAFSFMMAPRVIRSKSCVVLGKSSLPALHTTSPVKLEHHQEQDPQLFHTLNEQVALMQHIQCIFCLVGKSDKHHLENEHPKAQDHEVLYHTWE